MVHTCKLVTKPHNITSLKMINAYFNGSCKLAAKLGKPNKKIQPNSKHKYTIMLSMFWTTDYGHTMAKSLIF